MAGLILFIIISLLSSPVTVDRPLYDGATLVTGTAQPGSVVTLRVIQNPALSQEAQVDNEGVYRFVLDAPLSASYVVLVTSNGSYAVAIVEQVWGRVYLPMVMK